MGNLTSDNLSKITARAGVARAACSRAGCAPLRSQLDANGLLLIKRANDADGDPVYSTATWTNERGEA